MGEKNNLNNNDKKNKKKIDSLSLGFFCLFAAFFVLIFGSFPGRVQSAQSTSFSYEIRIFFAVIFFILSAIFFYKHKKSNN